MKIYNRKLILITFKSNQIIINKFSVSLLFLENQRVCESKHIIIMKI